MFESEKNLAILKNMLQLCAELNVTSIAEGVERADQHHVLLALGCNLGQGYLYDKPLKLSKLKEMIESKEGRDTPLKSKLA